MSVIKKRRKEQARKKYWQEKKDKLTSIFSFKSSRKKFTAMIVGGTLAIGGGVPGSMYGWQEYTKEDVTFTVTNKEQIIKRDCTETVSLKDTKVNDDGESEGPPVKETLNQSCEQDISYRIYTDKGVFNNDPSWLQSKFDAAKLQNQFEIGKVYDATFYGNDITGKNLLKAKDYVDWSESKDWKPLFKSLDAFPNNRP